MNDTHLPLGPVLFEKLARVVTAGRWVALALCLAVTGVSANRAWTQLHVDNRSESLLGSDSPAMATLGRLEQHFGHDEVFLVVAQGDVFTADFLGRLRALHTSIAGRGLGVTSLVNASVLENHDGTLERRALLEAPPSADALPDLEREVLANPALVDHVVTRDGQAAMLLVRSDAHDEAEVARVDDELEALLREADASAFRLRVTGMPALDVALDGAMAHDMPLVMGACLFAMVLILAFLYRGPFGVIGPLLVVIQAVIWTLGAMAYFDVPVTGVTSVLASFLICVGMADSIHVQSIFRDLRRDGASPRDAVVGAVSQTGVPVLLTSLTTMAGLLSFRTASLAAVADMGTFGALGVAVALLLSLVFLPAFLTFHRGGGLGARAARAHAAGAPLVPDTLDRVLAACNAASKPSLRDGKLRHGRRNLVVLAATLVTVSAGFGLARLEGRHDPLRWLPATNPARLSLEAVDATLGGTATVQVLVSAPLDQTLAHEDVMTRLAALEAHALTYRAPGDDRRVVTGVTSVLDPLRAAQRALSGEPDGYRLPESEQGTLDAFAQLRAADPTGLRAYLSDDGTHALMTLRVRWLEAGEYAPLEAHLERGIREEIGSSAHVELTGSAYAGFEVVSALIVDLTKSFVAAVAVVTLLLIMLFGDFKLGLIAMLPSLLPLAVVGGTMGALRVPLDLNTLMVASIVIGIAVDDTIHFFYTFHAHEPMLGTEGGVDAVFAHTARAIVATSVVLAVGFACFGFAQLANVRHFGLLVSLTVLVALVANLVFTPALLRAVYHRGRQPSAPPEPAG
ncbi:MAG: MMPL family transporter [Myxococcales bacterium]|nr:MMPL family transporter [Myxococcales bacterium]MCB9628647.1 MMPL family transporter [Sandaracinaceae bacterium]